MSRRWPDYALRNVVLVLNLVAVWGATAVWIEHQDPHWIDHVTFVSLWIAAIGVIGLALRPNSNAQSNPVPEVCYVRIAAAIASAIILVLGAVIVVVNPGNERSAALWWVMTGILNLVLLRRIRIE